MSVLFILLVTDVRPSFVLPKTHGSQVAGSRELQAVSVANGANDGGGSDDWEG